MATSLEDRTRLGMPLVGVKAGSGAVVRAGVWVEVWAGQSMHGSHRRRGIRLAKAWSVRRRVPRELTGSKAETAKARTAMAGTAKAGLAVAGTAVAVAMDRYATAAGAAGPATAGAGRRLAAAPRRVCMRRWLACGKRRPGLPRSQRTQCFTTRPSVKWRGHCRGVWRSCFKSRASVRMGQSGGGWGAII